MYMHVIKSANKKLSRNSYFVIVVAFTSTKSTAQWNASGRPRMWNVGM